MATRKHKELCSGIMLMLVMGIAIADDSAWRYDTSRRTEPAPSCAVASIAELDGFSFGRDVSSSKSIDKWYWTVGLSNAIGISCEPGNTIIIFR
ncbi:MAG: hypothetical protein IJL17_19440 [Kiritimatiellae bacterium]|nr:hypothetical protein [Kiritimatiellia bacterium]